MAKTKQPVPSLAQARRLAWLWGSEKTEMITEYVAPTQKALIKHGWIVSANCGGKTFGGNFFEEFRISDHGIAALERFFWMQRMKASS